MLKGSALFTCTFDNFNIHRINKDQASNLEIKLKSMSANISDFRERNKLWSIIISESIDDDCCVYRGKRIYFCE